MPDGAARLFWLYGPPCAGKSTTAWHLHEHLLAGPRAHVDVDQVGMSYPERADDPDRFALKARSVGALVRRLVAAGARTVVVSGVLDPPSLHALRTEETPGIAVTFCRLRVEEAELAGRLRARYGPADVQRALDEARAADARPDGHPTLDAGPGGLAEVARRALDLLESADATVGTGPAPAAPDAGGPAVAVLVCGTTAVGTSTAGFALFSGLLDRGRPTSFLDLAQLGLRRDLPTAGDDPGGSRLTAACVADVWRQHRAAGSRTLVLVGHAPAPADSGARSAWADIGHLRAALGDVPLLVCRLRAGRSALHARIRERTLGRGPALAGDTLVGLDTDGVQDVLDRALAAQDQLDAAEVADVVLDTDDLDAGATADRLLGAVDRRFGSVVTPRVGVRRAVPADAAEMARVHVLTWRQTYRGLLPDDVLDDPGSPASRERFWTAALTDPRWRRNRAAVAEVDGHVVGIAMAGPPEDPAATEDLQLFLVYVDAAHHRSGAGTALLGEVLPAGPSVVALWVLAANPGAQEFYRRHGFRPDGRTRVVDGAREVRWVRDGAGT